MTPKAQATEAKLTRWYTSNSNTSAEQKKHQQNENKDFPGGTVVKNQPANAGDTGSIPGLGRSHMPWSNEARVPQLLSLCSRAHEPQLRSPHATTTETCMPRAPAPQQEKPPQ